MPGEDYQSWSVTALNNGNADTAIEWREGQTRASVNNSSRSEMAAHAKNRNLLNGSIVTGGSANAQTFTSGVGYTAPIPTGLMVKLKIGAGLTNGAGATSLNMDGTGDTLIKLDTGENLAGGELVGGCYADLLFDGTNWIFLYSREFLQNQIDGGGGVIIGKQVFSTPGTFVYTPSVGTECAIFEIIGGGGGGGGVLATSLGTASGAAGGGAGSRSLHTATATDIGTSQPVIVGDGGTAGLAGGAGGGSGGQSSVGALVTAPGGDGGSSTSGAIPVGSSFPPGGAGGAAGIGNMVAGTGAPGGEGFYSLNLATTMAFSGEGGSSALGGGGVAQGTPNGSATNGTDGTGYGSGGGGGVSSNGGSSATGGAGAPGIVIITEFAGRGVPGRDGVPGAPGPIGPTGPSGPGTGDVLKSGVPAVGQIAQWVDASHIKGVDLANPFTTGDAKLTFKTTADVGWVMANDGSIGNATSSATTRANADTSALFALLYTSIPVLVVQDSAGVTVTRGASAAADYAANRRLVLPATLGRALACAGAGSGLTPRSLGTWVGEENHVLSIAELAAHTHPVNDPGHAHPETVYNNVTLAGGDWVKGVADSTGPTASPSGPQTAPVITGISLVNTGSGNAHNTMQPTTFLNVMIKL